MKMIVRSLVVVALLVLGGLLTPDQATAGEQTVKLSVPDMNCIACPITVRKSLERVEGVIEASADLDTRTAVVIYDPSVTDTAALTEATNDVGYPSSVIGEGS